MFHFPFRVAEIATNLLAHKPVLILGPMGSGKFKAAVEAMEMVQPSTQGSLSYINIEMKYARLARERDILMGPFTTRPLFFDKVKRVLENNPKRNLIYSDVEYATPEWVAPMLEQMMFSGRRVALVGDLSFYTYYMPILERCHIVRM